MATPRLRFATLGVSGASSLRYAWGDPSTPLRYARGERYGGLSFYSS